MRDEVKRKRKGIIEWIVYEEDYRVGLSMKRVIKEEGYLLRIPLPFTPYSSFIPHPSSFPESLILPEYYA
jgi:hypothetical protein